MNFIKLFQKFSQFKQFRNFLDSKTLQPTFETLDYISSSCTFITFQLSAQTLREDPGSTSRVIKRHQLHEHGPRTLTFSGSFVSAKNQRGNWRRRWLLKRQSPEDAWLRSWHHSKCQYGGVARCLAVDCQWKHHSNRRLLVWPWRLIWLNKELFTPFWRQLHERVEQTSQISKRPID